MKVTSTLAFITIILCLSSCKFSNNYEGTYHGNFEATGLPNLSGDGTLTLSADYSSQYSLLFTSSGNPDISMNGFTFIRSGDLYGGQYISNLSDSTGTTYGLYCTPQDNKIYLTISGNNSITFSGYR